MKNIIIGILSILLVLSLGYNYFNREKDNLDNDIISDNEIKEIDFSSLRNSDGTYGIVESIFFSDIETDTEEKYSDNARRMNLRIDGTVGIYYLDGSNAFEISNVSNIVDIVKFWGNDGETNIFYMLSSDGNIFEYKIENAYKNVYKADKMENISGVRRIETVNNCWTQGCGWSVIAIRDEDFVTLGFGSI